jgi:hypothetical protein
MLLLLLLLRLLLLVVPLSLSVWLPATSAVTAACRKMGRLLILEGSINLFGCFLLFFCAEFASKLNCNIDGLKQK